MRQRINRRLITLTVAIVAMLVTTASPAMAGGIGTGAKQDGYQGSASTDVGSGNNGDGGGSGNCTYQPAALTVASTTGEVGLFDGVEHQLYSRFCDGVLQGTVWVAMFTPADVLVMARQQIERTLPEPSPLMVWPDPDFDWAYAQVPIDFRADPAHWQPFQDTATASNPIETVSVTIRAEPSELVLTSGDPNGRQWAAACDGDGPVAVYNPKVPGLCSYTYINASSTAQNGKSFVASMAISWNIRYWSTTHPGFSGTLPTITRDTVFPMEVAEVKILSTTKFP